MSENVYYTRKATDEESQRIEPIIIKMFKRNISCIKQLAGGPFSAAVIDGNYNIVSIGVNAVVRRKDVSRHAEIEAMAKASKKLGTIDLSPFNLIASHFPCLMCYNAIKWAGIKRIFYIFDYEETEKIFGFKGDTGMCETLGVSAESFQKDNSLEKVKIPLSHLGQEFHATLDNLKEVWQRYKEKIIYDVNLL